MDRYFCLAPFLLAAALRGAFEPSAESPWLQGFAGALFPRNAAAISLNPAAPAMLNGRGVCLGASRPFGLRELQRASLAGNTFVSGMGVGALLTGTSHGGYSEFTAAAAAAFRLARGVVAGISLSGRRLALDGYGAKTALGVDAGGVCRPAEGIYLGGGCRGVVSTELAGTPAVPRAVFLSAGVVPLPGFHISGAAVFHAFTGSEFGISAAFSLAPGLVLGAGCLTGPVRLGFSAGFETGRASVSYGYGTHPDLGGTHLAEVGWGSPAFEPEPCSALPAPEEEPAVVFPVNINTATGRELEAIPGIGPSRASAILSWVEENGPVERVEDLEAVPGIGPATLEVLIRHLYAE
jgi:competence ComEA-like helix-hairpin-helix protein